MLIGTIFHYFYNHTSTIILYVVVVEGGEDVVVEGAVPHNDGGAGGSQVPTAFKVTHNLSTCTLVFKSFFFFILDR